MTPVLLGRLGQVAPPICGIGPHPARLGAVGQWIRSQGLWRAFDCGFPARALSAPDPVGHPARHGPSTRAPYCLGIALGKRKFLVHVLAVEELLGLFGDWWRSQAVLRLPGSGSSASRRLMGLVLGPAGRGRGAGRRPGRINASKRAAGAKDSGGLITRAWRHGWIASTRFCSRRRSPRYSSRALGALNGGRGRARRCRPSGSVTRVALLGLGRFDRPPRRSDVLGPAPRTRSGWSRWPQGSQGKVLEEQARLLRPAVVALANAEAAARLDLPPDTELNRRAGRTARTRPRVRTWTS